LYLALILNQIGNPKFSTEKKLISIYQNGFIKRVELLPDKTGSQTQTEERKKEKSVFECSVLGFWWFVHTRHGSNGSRCTPF